MLSFLGGVVGKALASVLTTLLGWLGIYRAGEKAQASKDQAATLKGAEDANQIRDKVAGESDAQLDASLNKFMRGTPGDR